MPSSVVKSFAKDSGESVKEVESKWEKAKQIAKENGYENNFAYITGVLKKMLNVNEDTTTADIAKVDYAISGVEKRPAYTTWLKSWEEAKKAILK